MDLPQNEGPVTPGSDLRFEVEGCWFLGKTGRPEFAWDDTHCAAVSSGLQGLRDQKDVLNVELLHARLRM